MTGLLITITLILCVIVAMLGVSLFRMKRAAREQADARASALAEMIGAAPLQVREEPRAARAIEPVPAADVPFTRSETTAYAADTAPSRMFGAGDGPATRSPRLLLVPAMGVLVVGAALSAIYVWNRPNTTPAAMSQQAATPAPLELVSLRHQRQGDALTISGLVRNPVGGQPVRGIAAVAFAFDRQGAFLTSGRAPLDFSQLQAGDESPFAITLPAVSNVARYRVSFRTDAGVVAHVDRRDQPVAALRASGSQR